MVMLYVLPASAVIGRGSPECSAKSVSYPLAATACLASSKVNLSPALSVTLVDPTCIPPCVIEILTVAFCACVVVVVVVVSACLVVVVVVALVVVVVVSAGLATVVVCLVVPAVVEALVVAVVASANLVVAVGALYTAVVASAVLAKVAEFLVAAVVLGFAACVVDLVDESFMVEEDLASVVVADERREVDLFSGLV